MLEAILPTSVSVAATRADVPGAALLRGEEAAVARAVESRRREFATARACARAALAPWGLSGQAIPALPGGAPRWPAGMVGSITHCDGYRGCAVARTEDVVTVGVDAEPNEPLPDGLLSDVAVAREREWVRDLLRRSPGVRWDRLLFSTKEAVYKAWFPLTARPLGFEDAVVCVDPPSRSFTARLLVPGPPFGGPGRAELSGRWLVRDGLVLTAIALPVAAASGTGTAG